MEKDFTFNGQRPGERVVAVVRNHPFVLFWPGIKTILYWTVAIAVVLTWSNEYAGLTAFIFFIVGIGLFSRAYFTTSQSVLLLTSQRVVSIAQTGFWIRRITETELKNIQDVSSETTGMFRTMLKFGNLIIRTSGAAQGSEIVIKNIPNPYEVQQLIAGTK